MSVVLNDLDTNITGPDEIEYGDWEQFHDELTGQELPTEKVREARLEEIEFLNKFPVYVKVPIAPSRGKIFIKVRWIDHNKGDKDKLNIRSRLVAREFKFLDPYMDGTFAPTPPIEAMRYLFHWMATTHRRNGQRLEMKMIVLDVSRAHFHPEAVRECYVELPEEAALEGSVGKLFRTMYGTRDAAAQWDSFANKAMEGQGYETGMSSTCVYKHKTVETRR